MCLSFSLINNNRFKRELNNMPRNELKNEQAACFREHFKNHKITAEYLKNIPPKCGTDLPTDLSFEQSTSITWKHSISLRSLAFAITINHQRTQRTIDIAFKHFEVDKTEASTLLKELVDNYQKCDEWFFEHVDQILYLYSMFVGGCVTRDALYYTLDKDLDAKKRMYKDDKEEADKLARLQIERNSRIIHTRANIASAIQIHNTHKQQMKELEYEMRIRFGHPKYVSVIEYEYDISNLVDVHDIELNKVILTLIRHHERQLKKPPTNIDENDNTIAIINSCIKPAESDKTLRCMYREFYHSSALCESDIAFNIYECGYIDASEFNLQYGKGLAQELIKELRNADIKETSDTKVLETIKKNGYRVEEHETNKKQKLTPK